MPVDLWLMVMVDNHYRMGWLVCGSGLLLWLIVICWFLLWVNSMYGFYGRCNNDTNDIYIYIYILNIIGFPIPSNHSPTQKRFSRLNKTKSITWWLYEKNIEKKQCQQTTVTPPGVCRGLRAFGLDGGSDCHFQSKFHEKPVTMIPNL